MSKCVSSTACVHFNVCVTSRALACMSHGHHDDQVMSLQVDTGCTTTRHHTYDELAQQPPHPSFQSQCRLLPSSRPELLGRRILGGTRRQLYDHLRQKSVKTFSKVISPAAIATGGVEIAAGKFPYVRPDGCALMCMAVFFVPAAKIMGKPLAKWWS